MHWVCSQMPNSLTLHALYTSIRIGNKINESKPQIEGENFKIWQNGKAIYIIMDSDKIENNSNFFDFCNGFQKIRLISIKDYDMPLWNNDFINISGKFIYSYKYYDEKNTKKYKEVCPIGLNGLLKLDNGKNQIKTSFIEYMERNTGLNFIDYLKNTSSLRFERVYEDEKDINNEKNKKKILFKNIIYINANLKINNIENLNKLYYSSIGKKRTYGFGSLILSDKNEEDI